jgi:hypothetical protein
MLRVMSWSHEAFDLPRDLHTDFLLAKKGLFSFGPPQMLSPVPSLKPTTITTAMDRQVW